MAHRSKLRTGSVKCFNDPDMDLVEEFDKWKATTDRKFQKMLKEKKAALEAGDGLLNEMFERFAAGIGKIDKKLLDMPFREFCVAQSQADEGPSDAKPVVVQIDQDGNGKRALRPRQTVLNTPLNTRRLPRMITPKICNGTEIQARVLGPDEVAFSVTGTPVVVAPGDAVNEDAQHIADLLQMDDQDFTPETRKVVHNLRTIVRKHRES